MQPHRRKPTRLPRPWDSPGKNTGMGCHFLLQCMKVKSESEVAQSHPTLSDPMDCSLPGFAIHGTFQARELEWGAIAFSDLATLDSVSQKEGVQLLERHVTESPVLRTWPGTNCQRGPGMNRWRGWRDSFRHHGDL